MIFYSIALVVVGLASTTFAQNTGTTCMYTNCHGGLCMRYDGVEYCTCTNGSVGLFCEVPVEPCQNTTCQNGGICTNTPDGGRYCACAPGYKGRDCEVYDASVQCPTIEDGDMEFLPQCSLKTSLTHFSMCINAQLPYLDHGDNDTATCASKVMKTTHCIYEFIDRCSDLACRSVFDYGGVEVYLNISQWLYDPTSPFMIEIFELLCTPLDDTIGGYPDRTTPLNNGPAFCDSILPDRLWTSLVKFGNFSLKNPNGTCSGLTALRQEIYNTIGNSCDWNKTSETFPVIEEVAPNYLSKVFSIAHEYFLEWTVPGCESGITTCMYTTCGPGACVRYRGIEYCNCSGTNYTGLFCEVPKETCTNSTCNAGICTNGPDNGRYCTCWPNFSGETCENYDETVKCPNIADGDMMFLPTCSLKTTLEKLSNCVNSQLPYYNALESICHGKAIRTTHCIYNTVTECSGVACPSIYEYGGVEIYVNISEQLYNPDSQFMREIYGLLCGHPDQHLGFINRITPLNIGMPVCKNTIIDDIWTTLITHWNHLMGNPVQYCGILDNLRLSIFNLTGDQCDWSKISQAFPLIAGAPDNYLQNLLETARSYFLEWRVPSCQGPRCADHCMNSDYCSRLYDGSVFCVCRQRWSGPRCEKPDPTAVCPMPRENDEIFFPRCTLRNTIHQIFNCTFPLVHHLFGRSDQQTCPMAVHRSLHCVAEVVGNCSGLACPSIYDIPGVSEAVQVAFATVFNESTFQMISFGLCQPGAQHLILEYIMGALRSSSISSTLNLICPSLSLRDIEEMMRNMGRGSAGDTDLVGICRELKNARNRVHQAINSCDIGAIEPFLNADPHMQPIVQHLKQGLKVLKSIFRDYTHPMCQGIGGGDMDNCPMLTDHSNDQEYLSAYICTMRANQKDASEYMERFLAWCNGDSCCRMMDWNEAARVLGLQLAYGRISGGAEGLFNVLKANMPCSLTSTQDCSGGDIFISKLGCVYCNRARSSCEARSRLMDWQEMFKHYTVMSKIHKYVSMECRHYGSVDCPTDPPSFTDFTTMFPTMPGTDTYSSTSTSTPGMGSTDGGQSRPPPSMSPRTTSSGQNTPPTPTTKGSFHRPSASMSSTPPGGSQSTTSSTPPLIPTLP